LNRCFWPISEQSQADYEGLREAVLSGQSLASAAAAKFSRRGLAGLIAWPRAELIYSAVLLGADRPPWTPYADPRVGLLADSYELILSAGTETAVAERRAR
jgi:hypothetical protein